MNIIIVLVLIGLIAGWLSGMIGIGGGIIIVPALVFILGYSFQDAQGTSLAALTPPIGILAAYIFYKNGNVHIAGASFLAIGFVMGAFLGATTNHVVKPEIIEKAFAILLLILGIKMLRPVG